MAASAVGAFRRPSSRHCKATLCEPLRLCVLSQEIRDVPVSSVFVWDVVRRATRPIVGYPCNPNTLRKTAAVYFADRVGAGILSRLGWDAQQAFAYSWMTREVLNPVDPM